MIKTRAELLADLKVQLVRLRTACEQWELGNEAALLDISTVLVLLLDDGGRNTKSLLGTLKMLSFEFYSPPTRTDAIANDGRAVTQLAWLDASANIEADDRVTDAIRRWVPMYAYGIPAPDRFPDRKVVWHGSEFAQWWSQPVFGNANHVISRRELLRIVRDNLGAAHLDAQPKPVAAALYRGELTYPLSRIVFGGVEPPWWGDPLPHSAAVRQIAFELQYSWARAQPSDAPPDSFFVVPPVPADALPFGPSGLKVKHDAGFARQTMAYLDAVGEAGTFAYESLRSQVYWDDYVHSLRQRGVG